MKNFVLILTIQVLFNKILNISGAIDKRKPHFGKFITRRILWLLSQESYMFKVG